MIFGFVIYKTGETLILNIDKHIMKQENPHKTLSDIEEMLKNISYYFFICVQNLGVLLDHLTHIF